MEKSKRFDNFDILKGFAMLMVVVGHLVAEQNRWNISNWVNSFHLPLFMFVGGYLAYKFTNNENKNYKDLFETLIVKRFFSLVVPYIIWSFLLYDLIAGNFEIDLVGSFKTYILNPPGTVLWFLYTYFFLNCIYFIYLSAIRYVKGNIILDLFIILVLFIVGYFLQKYFTFIPRNIIVFFPYYFLGVIVCKYNRIEKIASNNYAIALIALSFFIASLLYGRNDASPFDIIYKIISGCCGALLFNYLVNRVELNNRTRSMLIRFGKNSIVIYIVHFTMLFSITKILNDYNYVIPQFWFFILALFFAIIISYSCLFIGNVINRIWILDGLFFGRWKKQID